MGSSEFGAPKNLALAAFVLAIVLGVQRFAPVFLSRIAVLTGIVVGLAVAVPLGFTDFDGVGDADWVGISTPFHFGAPTFEASAIISMLVVALVTMTETTGDLIAVGEMTGLKIEPRSLADGLRADGLSTVLGGVFNTFPYTAYAQNVGLVGMARVRSRWVVAAAGGILVLLGLPPKLGAVVAAIPAPVLGWAGDVRDGRRERAADARRSRVPGQPQSDGRGGLGATAVSPEGRITPYDLGIWNDTQVEALRRIIRFLVSQGTIPGIQLAHAGRKASTGLPWEGGAPIGPDALGWQPVGASPLPFDEKHPVPTELTVDQISVVVGQFADAARRALDAGFEVAEIHGAHGYLINGFLSPHSNHRTDAYGGSYENRVRFALEVVDAVREVWPEDKPLFFRISATDWLADGGWSADDTVRFAADLHAHGIDLLDVSTGGNASGVRIPTGPGYQVPYAARVKAETSLPVGAVGMITDPEQAEKILANGEADAVLLGRELLRNPSWARHAARELGGEVRVPNQYHRSVRVQQAP